MARKHDALFKFIFSDPANAASILTTVLPPAVLAQLDLSTLTVEPGSFVDEALSQRHSDLLYSVQYGGEELLLYLLVEHQGLGHRRMPLRMTEYMTRIWRADFKRNPERKSMVPILPIVIFHGPRGWRAPICLTEMFNLEPAALKPLKPWLPQVTFLLHDLSTQSDAELRARSTTAAAVVALGSLKHSDSPEAVLDWLKRTWRLVAQLETSQSGLRALEAVFRYAFHAAVPRDTLSKWVDRRLGAPAKEVLMTTADRLIQEGREIGRQEGREEGREEARTEERRATLRNLLRFRFGELSEETEKAILLISADRAQTLSEMLLDPAFSGTTADAFLAE